MSDEEFFKELLNMGKELANNKMKDIIGDDNPLIAIIKDITKEIKENIDNTTKTEDSVEENINYNNKSNFYDVFEPAVINDSEFIMSYIKKIVEEIITSSIKYSNNDIEQLKYIKEKIEEFKVALYKTTKTVFSDNVSLKIDEYIHSKISSYNNEKNILEDIRRIIVLNEIKGIKEGYDPVVLLSNINSGISDYVNNNIIDEKEKEVIKTLKNPYILAAQEFMNKKIK